ncbi:hypothetical protein [Pseudomonas sp. Marseille-QA0892]
MSDLAVKAVVTVGEGSGRRDIVVTELTPALMRQVLMNNPWPGDQPDDEAVARYQVDVWLFDDCRLSDLAVFTNLTIFDLEALPPSQLRKVLSKAKEINPDFFSALDRMKSAQPKH